MEKHQCQICNKCFHSGRALGGHMRAHPTLLPQAKDADHEQKHEICTSTGGGDAGGGRVPANMEAAYVLRENPKKKTKYSEERQQQCKDCGKNFPSWRSLFGHMRIHSAAATAAGTAVEGAEDSGETSALGPFLPQRCPRSRRSAMATPACSSSSISEQESEVEQLAYTLVLLSRDTSSWRVPSNEAEKTGIDASGIGVVSEFFKDPDSFFASDAGDESMKKMCDPSDSEINGCGVGIKKLRNSGKEILGLQSNAAKKLDDEPKIGTVPKSKKRKLTSAIIDGSGKRKLMEGRDFEVENFGASIKKEKLESSESGLVQKQRKVYLCPSCKKIFHSYQALGGHRAARSRQFKGCNAADTFSSQVNINMVQSHHQQQHHQQKIDAALPEFFDLNLPVTDDEEKLVADNGCLELKLWSVGSMVTNHEPLLGVAPS